MRAREVRVGLVAFRHDSRVSRGAVRTAEGAGIFLGTLEELCDLKDFSPLFNSSLSSSTHALSAETE